ncbi:MAG TPA: GNAT family N-acetyltransferase [Nocardioides sp.]
MIEYDGVVLRVPEVTDRQRWFELIWDPDEQRYGVPAFIAVPDSVDALDSHVQDARDRFDKGEPGLLVIAEAHEPDRFLGNISWRQSIHPEMGIADIGYGVHPDARGRGLASRAIALFARWLMEDADGPQLPRVQLDHSVENPASCRAALAGGFEREGIRRSYLPLREPAGGVRRHDVCLHGRVRS